ncbi:hypothetical protein Ac2012v2_002258 [Leucoagaricus gongylophorus]
MDTHSSPALPREIWDIISEMIPNEDLMRISFVKSEFFYRALRLRYGNMKFKKWTDLSTCRTLEHISEPFLAPFVRCIKIDFEDLQLSNVAEEDFGRTWDALVKALPRLVSVDKISLKCRNMAQARVDELLAMVLEIFGGKLSVFFFSGNMHLDYITALISAMRSNLTSLDLFLSTTDIEEICDLISRLRFGQLKHLGLRLPCNRSHTDLSEFMAFLSATRLPVLRSLRLDLGSNNVDFGTLSEGLSTGLLAAVVANMPESFCKIRTLDLFPTCDRSGFHTAISLSLNTLRSVCAHNRSLQPEELEHLVQQLSKCGCRKLKMLRINLSQLDIRVIDLLANSFRELTRLTIMIDENRNPGEFSISPTLETDLTIRNYQSWTLDDIGIWRGGSQVDWNILNTFARHVPSITSFWGNGHKEAP